MSFDRDSDGIPDDIDPFVDPFPEKDELLSDEDDELFSGDDGFSDNEGEGGNVIGAIVLIVIGIITAIVFNGFIRFGKNIASQGSGLFSSSGLQNTNSLVITVGETLAIIIPVLMIVSGIFLLFKGFKKRDVDNRQQPELVNYVQPSKQVSSGSYSYCIYCGAKISPQSKYCSNCGNKIK